MSNPAAFSLGRIGAMVLRYTYSCVRPGREY
jgi:hypothetical protein